MIPLRSKLIISFVLILVVVVPTVIVSISLSRKALIDSIGQAERALATNIIDRIEADLFSHLLDFYQGFDLPEVQTLLVSSNRYFDELSETERQNLIDARDELWQQETDSEDKELLQQEVLTSFLSILLQEIYKKHGREDYGYELYEEILVTNAHGALIAATNITTDYRQDDEDWWVRGVEENIFLEPVEFDDSSGAFSLPMVLSIRDEATGELQAVVKVYISMEQIANEVSLLSRNQTFNKIEILNEDGNIIYSTSGFVFLAESDYADVTTRTTNGYQRQRNKLTNQNELVAFSKSDGNRSIPPLALTGVVSASVGFGNPLFREYIIYQRLVVLVLAAISVLGILLATIFARHIVEPVVIIGRLAKGYSNADFKEEVPGKILQRKDEFSDLAKSFSSMREQLSELYFSLDKKVREQTQELARSEQKTKQRLDEYERLNQLMVDREIKMIELKEELKKYQNNTADKND